MNAIVRKLTKDSIVIRNWIALSNCAAAQNYTKTTQISLQDTLLDKVESDERKSPEQSISTTAETDGIIFTQNLQQKSTNTTALKAIEIINSIDSINDAYNQNRYLSYQDLKESKEFLHTCHMIHKNARHLSVHDTIYILRILLSFNVPSNTVLIQTLLQLIRASVNNLSIGQIMLTYDTLQRVEECPLVSSLLLALPHLFKQQAQIELCHQHNNLVKAFQFSCAIDAAQTTKFIVQLLSDYRRRMNSNDAVAIFHELCSWPKLDARSRILLRRATQKIVSNPENLHFKRIKQLLSSISARCQSSDMDFYIKDMIYVLCDALLKENITFEEGVTILGLLNKIRYSSVSFLESLAEKCIQDLSTLERRTKTDVYHFIQGFVIADHKYYKWDILERVLKNFINSTDYSLSEGAFIAFKLLSLDCYCPELLEKVFTLYRSKPDCFKLQRTTTTVLKLHWCVKLFYPAYNGVTIDEHEATQITIKPRASNYVPSIMESLKETVGGAEYIRHGLRTKFGQFVDYIVLLQTNRTPLHITHYENVAFVEELASLSDCIKILFFALPKQAYCFNKGNVSSTVRMQLKAIETLSGFHSIVINPYIWESFSSERKLMHLRNAIESIK